MAVRVTKQADGSFSLDSDDTSEDIVTTGLAMAALTKKKAEQKHFKKIALKEAEKLDAEAFERCKEAAKDLVLKITDFREPDAKEKNSFRFEVRQDERVGGVE